MRSRIRKQESPRAINLFPSGKRKGRPPKFTEEEKREKRRIKSQKQRDQNPEKAREITRRSEKKRNDAKALAAGRIPGKIGRPAVYTEEEKKQKRREKSLRYYYKNQEKQRALYAKKGCDKRKALKEGKYNPRVLKKLTVQERRAAMVRESIKRRVRLAKAEGSYTAEDIIDLFKKQKGKCSWCLKPFSALGGSTVDHYLPLKLGGSNDKKNLRLLCLSCNSSKGAKHPLEFAQRNGLLCW